MIHFQFAGSGGTLSSLIRDWSAQQECSGLWVATAYATVSGVRQVLQAVRLTQAAELRFIMGLDDHITQPGALELARTFPRSHLRVASLSNTGARFHPKVYYLKSARGAHHDLSIIGSSNLSYAALNGNCEVNSFAIGDSDRADQFFEGWAALWQIGNDLSDQAFEAYSETYDKVRRLRSAIDRVARQSAASADTRAALESDDTQVDPRLATTCWIEGGYITLMGRELEFKAEQALFFGLSPHGGTEGLFHFVTSDGNVAALRMKYQKNYMWRLQLNDEVPEVRAGLRPRNPDGSLGRSPYVAVFRRTDTPDHFALTFVDLNSPEFGRLKTHSERHGAIGRTRAREYGWF